MLNATPAGRFFCLSMVLCFAAILCSCSGTAGTPRASSLPESATSSDGSAAGVGDGQLYFDSPRQAVEMATPLLREKDWPTLARYYDLSDSSIDRAKLKDGQFFYQEKLQGFQHPAGFAHYKHPFAPGFRFMRTDPTNRQDVVVVTVLVEIDEGGGLVQRGLSSFYMRQSKAGWQFLPATVSPFEPTSQ